MLKFRSLLILIQISRGLPWLHIYIYILLIYIYIYIEEEAELIMKILTSCTNRLDKVMWIGAWNGQFTVSSAYHFHKELQEQVKGQPYCPMFWNTVWTNIWKLNISLANRVFIWSACQNGLPTNQNLFKRMVLGKPNWPIYCERGINATYSVVLS